jgi:hypothetical protein
MWHADGVSMDVNIELNITMAPDGQDMSASYCYLAAQHFVMMYINLGYDTFLLIITN